MRVSIYKINQIARGMSGRCRVVALSSSYLLIAGSEGSSPFHLRTFAYITEVAKFLISYTLPTPS